MKACCRTIAILILALLTCNAPVASACEGQGTAEIRTLSEKFFSCYNSGDFEGMAALFLFPARASARDASIDRNAVLKALELCFAELGRIERCQQGLPSKTMLSFEITGGGLPCPGDDSAPVTESYAVGFSRLKTGFVTISYCSTASGWAIGGVTFGVPDSDPDAQQVVKGLMRNMFHYMKELGAP